MCLEIGKEFDFGILINIAFTVELNVAGLVCTRCHMRHAAGKAITKRRLHLLSATNTHDELIT